MIFDSKNSKLAIFGTGGFAREVLCLYRDIGQFSFEELSQRAVFVSNEQGLPEEIMGVKVIQESSFDPREYFATIGIGDSKIRKKVHDGLAQKFKFIRFATLIHPNVVISPWVEVGEGVILCAGTILTCNIKIGKQVQLNLDCTVGHDCVIEDYVTFAPGVKVSGNCTIGEFSYLGTNASVKQGVNIKPGIVVGMAASVVKDLEVPGVYVGVPAKLR